MEIFTQRSSRHSTNPIQITDYQPVDRKRRDSGKSGKSVASDGFQDSDANLSI